MLPKELDEKLIKYAKQMAISGSPFSIKVQSYQFMFEMGARWMYEELRPGTPIEEDIRIPETTC